MQATRSKDEWPPTLAAAAAARAERTNWNGTACWRYAPEGRSRGRILMIHGFRGDHHGLEAIAGGLDDYEVWIPDLPGYGKSEELAAKHDLENYGAWLLAILDWLQPDVLVGHSFGTQILATESGQFAQHLKVILINPIVLSSMSQRDFANRVARLAYQLAAKLGKLGDSALRSWFLVRVMSVAMCKTRNLSLRRWIHNQHHKYFSGYRADRVAYEGFWAAAMTNVSDSWSASNSIPVRVLAGELDAISPISHVNAFANRIGATLTVLPKTGHLVHYETPGQVAEVIRDSLVQAAVQ